jgi:hypothetical protein
MNRLEMHPNQRRALRDEEEHLKKIEVDIKRLQEKVVLKELIDNSYDVICKECNQPSQVMVNGICNTCLSKKDENDVINWPKHYNTGKIQPIEAIEDWKLDFRLANAVKYISRCEHKGKTKQDLEKAIWYIERYIKIELNKDVSND